MPLRPAFPEEGELVVATVSSIRNFGAVVALDEYAKREAFIHLSEVAPGWVKYIRDHIREGQKVVARVLRVDTAKGQVDLSLKRINDHQRREKVQGWKNEQRAVRLLGQVAKALKISEEESTELFGSGLLSKYGSLYAAFEVASAEPKRFQQENEKANWVAAFLKVARDNIQPPHVAILGTLEIQDLSDDGLEHVRAALLAAEAIDPASVSIQYVGAPRYRIKVEASQYKLAEETLKRATEGAIRVIKDAGGRGSFTRA
ncbi:MAG: translation initiation factor IF-2 subunit alpha [Thermoplasmata archaeon]